MITTLLAQKLKQTQLFDGKGVRHPVTVLKAEPNVVVQIKTIDTDGYSALQLGFSQKREKATRKPQQGHFKKARLTTMPRFLREIRLAEDQPDMQPGSTISIDQVFYPGDTVSVTGITRGKGFAGVVKRHGFRGGPATHGQSDRERASGSVGQGTTPGRVLPGKRMAGRMGSETVTIKGLKIMTVDPKENILTVSGLIPGSVTGLVTVVRTEMVPRPSEPEKIEEETKEPKPEEKAAVVSKPEDKAPEENPAEQKEAKTA